MFKVGDSIRCIDVHNCSNSLTKDKIYVVNTVFNGDLVGITDDSGRPNAFFFDWRFIPVSSSSVELDEVKAELAIVRGELTNALDEVETLRAELAKYRPTLVSTTYQAVYPKGVSLEWPNLLDKEDRHELTLAYIRRDTYSDGTVKVSLEPNT